MTGTPGKPRTRAQVRRQLVLDTADRLMQDRSGGIWTAMAGLTAAERTAVIRQLGRLTEQRVRAAGYTVKRYRPDPDDEDPDALDDPDPDEDDEDD